MVIVYRFVRVGCNVFKIFDWFPEEIVIIPHPPLTPFRVRVTFPAGGEGGVGWGLGWEVGIIIINVNVLQC